MGMEDTVITKANLEGHSIGKYQFKILSTMGGSSVREAVDELEVHYENPNVRDVPVTGSGVHHEAIATKDALIESLLKKADDMSSSVIKMQMKLEDVQEEHAKTLEEAKKSSFDEGVIAGIAQENTRNAHQGTKAQEQLAASVKTLEEAAAQYAVTLEQVQKELAHTALEIASEVILVELNENSAKIAAKLSAALLEELSDASKITLRVNPADHGEISSRLGSLKHVEVLSDRAVSAGGVVAISDLGNIDSQIKKRFERLKRSLMLET
jgi:flagellar assembly protein FliH